jgi:hypothetical protein
MHADPVHVSRRYLALKFIFVATLVSHYISLAFAFDGYCKTLGASSYENCTLPCVLVQSRRHVFTTFQVSHTESKCGTSVSNFQSLRVS